MKTIDPQQKTEKSPFCHSNIIFGSRPLKFKSFTTEITVLIDKKVFFDFG